MEITIVAHYIDEKVGSGIARYTANLVNELKKRELTVRSINSFIWGKSRLKTAFDFFFFIPLKTMLCPTKSRIYHIVAPQIGFIIPLLKKVHKKKVITTIYDLYPIFHFGNDIPSTIIKESLKIAIKESDLLIVISSQTKNEILDNFNVPESKVVVTQLGTSGRFKPLKSKKNGFTVGYVGSFAGNKDVPFLVRAYAIFEKHKQTKSRLLLYGTGAQHSECIDLANRLGIKNIEFGGFISDEELVEVYNSFDIFVFPSVLEGFGLPIIEAQKCFIPVVVRKDAHIPDEVTRCCMKVGNEEELACVLEKNYHKRFKYSKRDKEHISSFNWENCASKTMEAYRRLETEESK